MFLLTTMPFYNVEIPIVIIAVAYIVTTLVIQRKATDTKKMRSVQLQIQEITKQLNEMIKNKAPNEEISKKQKEIMPLVTSSLKMQLKPMFMIFPLFILIYYILLPHLFGQYSKDTVTLFSFQLNYLMFFFAIVFLLGIISSIGILIYDKKKAAKEKVEFDVVGTKS